MHLKVAALQSKPLLILSEDENENIVKAKGVFGLFLENVFSTLNISYTVVKPKDNEWGVHNNGSWTGLYGMIFKNEVDMILSPSMITYDRMEIVKYSEGLYSNEAAILSAPSKRRYYKDILAHLNNLEQITWILLFFSTIIVAFMISALRGIKFFAAFWMVIKALLYKPIERYLHFTIANSLLMLYFYCIVFFWIDINQMIGAYLVTNQPDNLIDSIEDLADHTNTVPTVMIGTAFESLFQNENETKIKELWERMKIHNNQGLITREYSRSESFGRSIAKNEKVYIGGSIGITMNVINFCQKDPDLKLYMSRNLFMPSVMALAFKMDFDQKIINKINKLINNLKGMGIIDAWIHRSLIQEIVKINNEKVKRCIFNSRRIQNSISKSLGLLEDALPLFFVFIYAVIITFVALLIEFMVKSVKTSYEFKVRNFMKKFSLKKNRKQTVYRRNRQTNYQLRLISNKTF